MQQEYEVIFYDLPDGSEPVADFINALAKRYKDEYLSRDENVS